MRPDQWHNAGAVRRTKLEQNSKHSTLAGAPAPDRAGYQNFGMACRPTMRNTQASPQFAALIVIMYVYGLRVFWYF